jgi:hypothetical protein
MVDETPWTQRVTYADARNVRISLQRWIRCAVHSTHPVRNDGRRVGIARHLDGVVVAVQRVEVDIANLAR